MQHPSEPVVRESEVAARAHLSLDFARRSRWLAETYRAESELDAGGLRHQIIQLEQDGSIVPPTAPGLRGSIGAFLIKIQAAAFWWVVRAFRLRDEALRTTHTTLIRQSRMRDARERELYGRINELELRIRELERASGLSAKT